MIWDIVQPRSNIEYAIARLNSSVIGLDQAVALISNGKRIEVQYISEANQLGTQDGSTYTVKPVDDCSCEPNLQCYIHANKFTEKH